MGMDLAWLARCY